MIVEMESEIVKAIETGALWEIWLQVEIAKALRTKYSVFAREVRFSGSNPIDICFTQHSTNYLIQLKVESARHQDTFGGNTLEIAMDTDASILKTLASAVEKWCCCVAWSPIGKRHLSRIKFHYIRFGNSLTVGIHDVNR